MILALHTHSRETKGCEKRDGSPATSGPDTADTTAPYGRAKIYQDSRLTVYTPVVERFV